MKKPFAVWVISLGILYLSFMLLALVLPRLVFHLQELEGSTRFVRGVTATGIALVGLPLAYFTYREKRLAFLLAAILGLVALVLYPESVATWTLDVTNWDLFWRAFSGFPVLVIVVVFSILSFAGSAKGLATKRYLSTPISAGGLLLVGVAAFVIGGLLIGYASFLTIGRVSSIASQPVTVVIAQGAASPENGRFFVPNAISVVLGKNSTVTWFNFDSSVHTVTSAHGSFDSGNVVGAGEWRYTFTQPGVYDYYCTIHPFMKGSVVVKSE